MNLTLENWSYTNIKTAIEPLCHLDKVRFAVFCAEQVIDIYERYNPDNRAPRLAIEAAKAFISDPSESNKQACKKAAYPATAAATAADTAATAAYADTAATAAYAAYAAYADAYATAYAADAAYAAYAAAKIGVKHAILKFLENLLNPQKQETVEVTVVENEEHQVNTAENQTQFLSEEITSACEKHSLSLTYYKGTYLVFREDTEAEYKVKTVEEFDSLVNALDTLQNLVGD